MINSEGEWACLLYESKSNVNFPRILPVTVAYFLEECTKVA